MNYIPLPRFDGKTEAERLRQIENFIFMLIQQYNQDMSEIDRQIKEKQGGK